MSERKHINWDAINREKKMEEIQRKIAQIWIQNIYKNQEKSIYDPPETSLAFYRIGKKLEDGDTIQQILDFLPQNTKPSLSKKETENHKQLLRKEKKVLRSLQSIVETQLTEDGITIPDRDVNKFIIGVLNQLDDLLYEDNDTS